jgi:hypothetical protein
MNTLRLLIITILFCIPFYATSQQEQKNKDENVFALDKKEQKMMDRNVDSYRINVLKNLYKENSKNGVVAVDHSYLISSPLTFKELSNFSHPYLNIMVSQLTEKERDEIVESIREEQQKQARYQSIMNTAMKYAMASSFHFETRLYHDELTNEYYNYLSQAFPFSSLMIADGKIRPPLIEEIGFTTTIEDRRTLRNIRKRFRIAEQSEVIIKPPTFMDEFFNLLTEAPKPPNIYMLPINDDELSYWQKGIMNGWIEGVKLAHRVIRSDIRLLARRSLGYIRFHVLVDRGVVSMPDSQNVAVGTNARGDIVNIGESIFEIVRLPQLNDKEQDWIAIPQVDDIFDKLTQEDIDFLSDELLLLDGM